MKMSKVDNSVKITGMILGTVIVLAILGVAFYGEQTDFETIKVNGVSSLEVVPDRVSINFNVETNASTAKEAKDENSNIVDEVVSSLMALGYSREDIQTTNFNIWEDYDWSKEQRTLIGFRASHAITVMVPSNDLIGETIDAGVDAGAKVGYINFELSQELENEYKAQAITLATQDARTQAEAMAEGLGVKLGEIVSVSNTDFDYYPYPAYDMARMESAVSSDGAVSGEAIEKSISIQPGERTVNSRISAIYKIK